MEKSKNKQAGNSLKKPERVKKGHVFIALSGGVDSTFSAYLLNKKYQNVTAIFARLWEKEIGASSGSSKSASSCLNKQTNSQLEKVKKITNALKVPLKVIDLREEFKDRVVRYYLNQYQNGYTPNPCIVCNREIKFGLLRKKAEEIGGDLFATGHYVKKENNQIYRGEDNEKDQSYFMWNLKPKIFKKIIFPLGSHKKEEVKKAVKKIDLPVNFKSESKGACFYPRGAHEEFIKKHAKELDRPGKVVDKKGKVVGQHRGLAYYTIGQRYGFEVDPHKMGLAGQDLPPLYVIKLLPEKNKLVVGLDKDLYKKEMEIENSNWLIRKPLKKGEKRNTFVQIRHLGKAVKAQLTGLSDEEIKIKLNEPLRSVAPGQSAVFYDNDHLLGGGIIKQKAGLV